MISNKVIKILIKHEGYRQFIYQCTQGKWTIGIGRNLEDNGITEDEAVFLLDKDILRIEDVLNQKLSFYKELDDVRKAVLIDMAFNLGVSGLLKFTNTLKLIEEKKYEQAAKSMIDSKWAIQVKERAMDLYQMMKTGEWLDA